MKTVLTSLHASACKTTRKGSNFRFRLRRCNALALPHVQALTDMGVPVRIYTGSRIHSYDGSTWTTRRTSVTRSYTVVEVPLF